MMENPDMYVNRQIRRSQVTTVDLALEESAHRVRVKTLEAAIPVIKQIESWMLKAGYPRIDRFSISLALQEAVTNAVQHGHHGDPNKSLQITFAVRPNEVVIEVQDQGIGFDPELVPNPLLMKNRDQHRGWGLFMMRTYTSWLAVEAPGNRVVFGRFRSN